MNFYIQKWEHEEGEQVHNCVHTVGPVATGLGKVRRSKMTIQLTTTVSSLVIPLTRVVATIKGILLPLDTGHLLTFNNRRAFPNALRGDDLLID